MEGKRVLVLVAIAFGLLVPFQNCAKSNFSSNIPNSVSAGSFAKTLVSEPCTPDSAPTAIVETNFSQPLVLKSSLDNVGQGCIASNLIVVSGLKAPVSVSFSISSPSTEPAAETTAGIYLNGAPVALNGLADSASSWSKTITVKEGDQFYLVLPYVAWGNLSTTFDIEVNGIRSSWAVGTKNYSSSSGHNCTITGSASGYSCEGNIIAIVPAAPAWASKVDPSDWGYAGGCLDLAQQNTAVKCVLLPDKSADGVTTPTTCVFYSGPPTSQPLQGQDIGATEAANCP